MKTKKEILIDMLKAGDFIESFVIKGNSNTRKTKILNQKKLENK